MDSRTLADYGAPYENETPVENPKSQIDADLFNKLLEDSAELTHTGARVVCKFAPVASGNPTSINVKSMWGDGSAQAPSIVRSSTGVYVATFADQQDGLGNPVSPSFLYALGAPALIGPTDGHARIASIAGNVVTVNVYDATNALADLTSDTVSFALV